ncbi:MAG TPA: GNAT family N-acetyltransferase [Alphaproteobacteria bacterium]|jgi:RimJ/RimL family protein N-acetyltransferase
MAQTRKLLPIEGPLLADHLMRLSAEDRRLRFGGMLMRDESVRRYVESIDWAHSWHVGHFAEGGLRAVVQLSVPRRGADAFGDVASPWLRPGAAEFAVSVEKPWQRQGIATRLLGQAVVVARNRNVHDLYMLCLPENEPMRRLARKVGVNLVFRDGEITGHVDLPAPDQLTVFAEFAVEAAAAIDRWAELVAPPERKATSSPRS